MKAIVSGFCLALLLSVAIVTDVRSQSYNREDVFAPPRYCGKVWVKAHYNKQGQWVKAHYRHQYWVEGHYAFGKWVPGRCK